jgi:hypothetical protein
MEETLTYQEALYKRAHRGMGLQGLPAWLRSRDQEKHSPLSSSCRAVRNTASMLVDTYGSRGQRDVRGSLRNRERCGRTDGEVGGGCQCSFDSYQGWGSEPAPERDQDMRMNRDNGNDDVRL